MRVKIVSDGTADGQKRLGEHAKCDGCGHYACDCICDFLRDVWPTHPANVGPS